MFSITNNLSAVFDFSKKILKRGNEFEDKIRWLFQTFGIEFGIIFNISQIALIENN